jgi:hypothetical protein
MWIHLLTILLEQASRAKSSKPAPLPVERHRKVIAGPIVVECPTCRGISMATHYYLEELAADSGDARWKRVSEIFQCDTCAGVMASNLFENDGTGVMHVKQWQCSACNAVNRSSDFMCTGCHQWRH